MHETQKVYNIISAEISQYKLPVLNEIIEHAFSYIVFKFA